MDKDYKLDTLCSYSSEEFNTVRSTDCLKLMQDLLDWAKRNQEITRAIQQEVSLIKSHLYAR